ncbi:hypothetical protein MKW92_024693 [Papaver armeniacum]|nr:hypothetical protein MKW92_024693 [Papaver armeniacum]
MLYFTLLSTTSVMYTIACCYTSKDITYEKVTGVLGKLWGRLIDTFFCGLYMVAIYTYVALKLFSWFSDDEDILSFLSFYLPGFIYLRLIWNVATVVTVLEKDYGVKALAKGWRILYGKLWVSCAAVGLLESAFTGIIFTFCYLVVYGNKMNLVGKVFVGIGCYLLTTIWIHFSLAVYTVIYFVCKSYHNEDISTVAAHTAVVPATDLGSEKAEVQLEERVPV